ncbi:MAG: von Willebrand factor type A domain-containing protein [Planctomycetota bacterium]|nr:von Willebrand factor type A domain-containing protein [Planctomycetota bacterium]
MPAEQQNKNPGTADPITKGKVLERKQGILTKKTKKKGDQQSDPTAPSGEVPSSSVPAKDREEKQADELNAGQETDIEIKAGDPLHFEKKAFDGFERIDPALENEFVQPLGTQAISTLSVDTDTASYTNIRQKLRDGKRPHPEEVRIEEMINYFDFDYGEPKPDDRFSVNMEMATCPWSPNHQLLKVGLQARKISNRNRPASNLVFLVDVSGSMRNANKLPLLKKGLLMMVDQLREDDYVSVVTYSDRIETPLEPTDGSQKEKIRKVIESLVARGSTDGGEGLQTAYQLAEKHFLEDGTNRIVMGTDGDFNVGISDDRRLASFVKQKAKSGVFLTICGFGTDNFQDQKVQMMAQNGNGKVFYIDSEEESKRVFAERIAGTLVTMAKDVKLQLFFNPRTVQSYRLIGYENRLLQAQDFDNDQKDAAEMDAGDRVTVLYEIVPQDSEFTFPTTASPANTLDLKYQTIEKQKIRLTEVAASDDIAALRIRYKDPRGTESKLKEVTIQKNSTSFNRASRDFQLASAVAGLGMMLRGSRHRGTLTFAGLKELGQTLLADRGESLDADSQPKKGERPEQATGDSRGSSASPAEIQRKEIVELINRAEALYRK